MDFTHFEMLVRGTLQRDLTEPGLVIYINVRDEGHRWVAEVNAPGRGGAREDVPPKVDQAEAVAAAARLVKRIRDL
ncbi:hypothetical protein [Sorangium sp. So ce1151]|uniref:hypothetical protein n=1 Tax=Sorangium sp. So ce1151 TaxID=3133332 RepID=UPI003F5F2A80